MANYLLIEGVTLSNSTSAVTFQNIPQTGFTDLKIVISTRSNSGETTGAIYFNGDTTNSNYNAIRVLGEGNAGNISSSSTNNPYFFYMTQSTASADTYSNIEVYIPDYLSSNQKTLNIQGVTENNAAYAITHIGAGKWTGTNTISSITVRPYIAGGASFIANTTISLYGIAALGTTPPTPKAYGGDTIMTDGTYWYHAFLTSGTFVPTLALSADILTIASGAGGLANGTGAGPTGGGGAGGLVYSSSQSLVTGPYTVTVGAGGSIYSPQGNNSQFGALTAAVGGGRGGVSNQNGFAGGSGGGGGGYQGSGGNVGGTATSGQGNNGGVGYQQSGLAAGGGGGAGSTGGNAGSNQGGNGGAGVNTYSSWLSATGLGISGYIAGGGAGMSWYGGNGGTGGSGGGGNGASGSTGTNATSGSIGTGSGGGGSAYGTNGGSGVVIVRYAV